MLHETELLVVIVWLVDCVMTGGHTGLAVDVAVAVAVGVAGGGEVAVVAVAVAVAVAAGVGDAVAVAVAVGVGAGVPHVPQLPLTSNTMCMFGNPMAAVVMGVEIPQAVALK